MKKAKNKGEKGKEGPEAKMQTTRKENDGACVALIALRRGRGTEEKLSSLRYSERGKALYLLFRGKDFSAIYHGYQTSWISWGGEGQISLFLKEER